MKLKSLAKKAIIYSPPVHGLYALGGAVNELTGGKTKTYSLAKALKGQGSQNRFSKTTQATSGYTAPVPRAGDYRLPVVNRATPQLVGQVAGTVVHDVAAPVADAASKSLLGVSLRTLGWVAGGSALGLGALAVATR